MMPTQLHIYLAFGRRTARTSGEYSAAEQVVNLNHSNSIESTAIHDAATRNLAIIKKMQKDWHRDLQ